MHSSRIRTARSLTVSRSIRLGGVSTQPPPGCRHPLDADPSPWMQTPPPHADPLDADLPGCRPPSPPRGQNDKLRLRAVIIARPLSFDELAKWSKLHYACVVALILPAYDIELKSGLFFFQYGDSELLYKVTMEEMMNKYYGFDVYNPPDRVDLRVNTSIYVMWSNKLHQAGLFQ